MEERVRYREQISVKSAKSNLLQREGNILCRRRLRNISNQTNGIKWPEIEIFSCVPESPWSNGLTIVHIAFGRIITENSVDDDLDFALVEPAVRTKPSFCLDGGSRHHKKGENAHDASNQAFDEEQPAPASPASDTTEMK